MAWKPEVFTNPNPLPPRTRTIRVVPLRSEPDQRVVIRLSEQRPTKEVWKVQVIQGGKNISVRPIS